LVSGHDYKFNDLSLTIEGALAGKIPLTKDKIFPYFNI